jgi:hypothetical protein
LLLLSCPLQQVNTELIKTATRHKQVRFIAFILSYVR